MTENSNEPNTVRLTIFASGEDGPCECCDPEISELEIPADQEESPVDQAMGTLLERLEQAEMSLQGASFRLGYLQNEVDKYRDALRLLPDMQTVTRKAAEAERRHDELLKQLPEMERRLQRLPKLQRDNEVLRVQVEQVCAAPRPAWWQFWKRLSPAN